MKIRGSPSCKDAINFLFNVSSGRCDNDYPTTPACIDEFDSLFENFNGGTYIDQRKTVHLPFNDNDSHRDHWMKASIGIKGKLPFFIVLYHRMGGQLVLLLSSMCGE